ncbi:MAG: hypothetical protein LQ350_008464 [Teloschistes chrysophthalmus]|nr:MAG: hypothetical protein LQ350_008464 [Niorma chrysophthalma]
MRTSNLFTIAASLTTAYAQTFQGFNYGSVFTNNAPVTQQDFENEFNTARQLQGTSGFTSARLFTMIQAGTTNAFTQAIPAAKATNTHLLLGIFLSSTDEAFNNELTALRAAIAQYGQDLADLIIGISVGSEDLYRISPIGIENKSNPGEGPDAIVRRINAVKAALSGTVWSGKPVGHVDTWTAYVNASNSAVIEASDFIGTDAYPYFQNTMPNSIENGASLFFEAYNATVAVSGGKPVWITETGWPVSGPVSNQAVASLENAKTYWDQVGCRVFGQINTFWYTLQDAYPNTPSPSFGVVGTTLSNTPLYDLSCGGRSSSSKTTSSTSSAAIISSQAMVASTESMGGQSSAAPPPPSASAGSGGSGSSGSSSGAPVAPVPASPVASTKTILTYTTLTTCPVTYTSGAQTLTSFTTSAVAVTSTHGSTFATVTTSAGSGSGSGSGSGPAPTSSSCPTDLSGAFEYPHLIIPVDKSHPDTAAGTSYNGIVSPTVSSIFNFDYPSSLEGHFCSLVFLFPTRDALQTSNYTLSGTGGLSFARLVGPAVADTTFNNQPAVNVTVGSVPDLQPGNNYVIASGGCFGGQRVAYEVSATGSLDLNYFQDYNPEPIGVYITVC